MSSFQLQGKSNREDGVSNILNIQDTSWRAAERKLTLGKKKASSDFSPSFWEHPWDKDSNLPRKWVLCGRLSSFRWEKDMAIEYWRVAWSICLWWRVPLMGYYKISRKGLRKRKMGYWRRGQMSVDSRSGKHDGF